MHWVWNHSQSKGNPRLALLAVADQTRTPACEVRMSHADFAAALNASRSVAKGAVKTAVESGELEILELGKGTRRSLYRLPKAVGYIRPANDSGPDSGPLAPSAAPRSGPDSGPVAGSQETASGPDSGPQWAGFRPSSGPDSGPHSPSQRASQQAGPEESAANSDEYGIPDFARPLVDGLTNAGVVVRWPFVGQQWVIIHALIKKSGVTAMVDHARKAAGRANVESAKYFMQGWRELPPVPQAPASVPRPRVVPDWCEDIDCDEVTRFREVEDKNGLRVSVPCPQCHPNRKKTAA